MVKTYAKKMVSMFCLLATILFWTSCTPSSSGSGYQQWRNDPMGGMPPSWENDIGRPGAEYDGVRLY